MAETATNLYRIVGACMIYRFSGEMQERIEYLILKRHPDAKVYPGLWGVPSGGMERSDYASLPKITDGWETPLQVATRREIREESGVEVGELQFLHDFTFDRPDGVQVFGIRFAAPWTSGEVVLDPHDATEYAWVTADRVGQYELLGNIAAEIVALDKQLRAT